MKKILLTFIFISYTFSLAIAQEVTATALRKPQSTTNNLRLNKKGLIKKTGLKGYYKRIKTLKQLSLDEIAFFANKLYKNNMFEELDKLYKKNKNDINKVGKHNYTMALFFFKTKRIALFHKQTLFYLINEKGAYKLKIRLLKKYLRTGDYTKIIETIRASSKYPKIDKLHYHLLIHSLLKNNKYKEAHKTIRNRIISVTNPSIQEITLLIKLALKLKDGSEAAFWGNKILKDHAQQIRNPILLNNMAIAYLYQYKNDPKVKSNLETSLKFHQKSLKLKKSFYTYHTGSLIYEAKNDLKKALRMLNFCRALKPKDKKIISRYRLLQRKHRKGKK